MYPLAKPKHFSCWKCEYWVRIIYYQKSLTPVGCSSYDLLADLSLYLILPFIYFIQYWGITNQFSHPYKSYGLSKLAALAREPIHPQHTLSSVNLSILSESGCLSQPDPTWARFDQSPAQKHDPTKNTLNRILRTSSKERLSGIQLIPLVHRMFRSSASSQIG